MVVTFSRRTILKLTGVSGSFVLAGCSSFSSESPMLNLTLFSHADSPYTVEMSLLRNDSDRSGPRIYDESINVAPQGEASRKNVAETRPYLVRYSAYENNSKQTDEDHVHYYPTDGGGSDSLTFDISSAGVVTRR